MRGFLIIVFFMIFKPFMLPIPLETGICLAGAVDLAWFIAFRAYPSQHSCFGIPLKAQHCCPFLTLHVARRRPPKNLHAFFVGLTALASLA